MHIQFELHDENDGRIRLAKWSPHNSLLGVLYENGTFKLWNAVSQSFQDHLQHPSRIDAFAWHDENDHLAIAGSDDLEVADGLDIPAPAQNSLVEILCVSEFASLNHCEVTGRIHDLYFSGNQLHISRVNIAHSIWDTVVDKLIYSDETAFHLHYRLTTASLKHAPPRIMQLPAVGISKQDGLLHLVDVEKPGTSPYRKKGRDFTITYISSNPQKKLLASACMDGTLILWDSQSLTAIEELTIGQVSTLHWNIQKNLLAAVTTSGDLKIIAV
jgi:WD40 repeat protein